MSAATEQLDPRLVTAQGKARVLREALPWMTRWRGRTIVVKYGGNAMTPAATQADAIDPLVATFAADVALLHSVGVRVVVVHGGGPQITAMTERLGITATFVDGRRVTDGPTLDIARMVLLGQVNPALVGVVTEAGAPAVGVSGLDHGLLVARQADPALGHVGDVVEVGTTVLDGLMDDGAVPVVATMARGEDGATYNVNADAAAAAIAAALGADKLIYLTNVAGLYRDFGTDTAALLSVCGLERLRSLLAAGDLVDGIIPKVASIVEAMDGGVAAATLLNGTVEHALLLEIFTDAGVGTMIVPGDIEEVAS